MTKKEIVTILESIMVDDNSREHMSGQRYMLNKIRDTFYSILYPQKTTEQKVKKIREAIEEFPRYYFTGRGMLRSDGTGEYIKVEHILNLEELKEV